MQGRKTAEWSTTAESCRCRFQHLHLIHREGGKKYLHNNKEYCSVSLVWYSPLTIIKMCFKLSLSNVWLPASCVSWAKPWTITLHFFLCNSVPNFLPIDVCSQPCNLISFLFSLNGKMTFQQIRIDLFINLLVLWKLCSYRQWFCYHLASADAYQCIREAVKPFNGGSACYGLVGTSSSMFSIVIVKHPSIYCMKCHRDISLSSSSSPLSW